MSNVHIHRQAILPTQAEYNAIKEIAFRKVPNFLGDFTFSCFGGPYGQKKSAVPADVLNVAHQLALLHPEQTFNTLFLQRYQLGQSVKRHRDPRNNVGHTLILALGEFEGATTSVQGETPFTLKHGDVLRLPCTINGIQGPPHEVSAITSGERFALILNTIV